VTLATPTLGVIPHPLCSTRLGWSNKENTQKYWSTPKLWRPSAILDFRKSDFWAMRPLGLPIFHLGVKFGAKISKSEMAAVRHLGFVTSSHQTTHKVLSLAHIGLNFMLIRCIIVLKILWWFEFFCRFGLKCLFTPPKFWFLGLK